MQGSLWVKLLRRIPAELHNALALGLVTGDEVVVQQLIRMDNDFVIVRGRMSGSTAEGRIMLVPYAQMTLVAVNKQIPEAEVQAIFGQETAGAAPSIASAAGNAETGQMPLPAPRRPDTAPSVVGAASQIKAPSKSVLLARLRERLAEKAK